MLKLTLSKPAATSHNQPRLLRDAPIVLALEALQCSRCGVTAETAAFRPFTARAVGDGYDVVCSGCSETTP